MAVTVPSATEQISYADLYRRWERGNWRASEIDFSRDRVDWRERLSEEQRRGALWMYSLFFHGEDSVADNLSPYIDAAPTEEQSYFLTTQQVDEARHSVLFRRFMEEVVGVGGGYSTAATLEATRAQLTWGHRMTFSRLDRMADELRRDRSPVQLARAVTLYHIVIEAALAQPGQHLIERSLEELDVLPGFREGIRNVALDEQRHIAFGVRLLADLHREDPEPISEAIVSTLREVLPWTTATGYPPDRRYLESFGFSVEDLYEEGARAQEARLRAIGLSIDDIPGFPLPLDLPPRERGERGIRLLEAGYLGEPGRPLSRAPDDVELLFDTLRRGVDHRTAPDGTTIVWDVTDLEPWSLRIGSDGTSAERGALRGDRTLTLSLSFADLVGMVAGTADPRKLLLRRRLRPRGDVRTLLRLGRMFGG